MFGKIPKFGHYSLLELGCDIICQGFHLYNWTCSRFVCSFMIVKLFLLETNVWELQVGRLIGHVG
jgi:hypothetical protein